MPMKFLIELGVFPENEKVFAETLTDMQIDHAFWDGQSNPPYDKKDNKVFFIGSIITALKIKQVGYAYQVWLGKEFDYSYFGSHLKDLLNSPFYLITHAQALVAANQIVGADRNIQDFVRSDSGYKKFQGDLYSVDMYLMESERKAIPKEEVMVFAEKRNIAQEYRLVVKCKYDEISDLWEYDIVTYAQYAGEDKPLTSLDVTGIISDLSTSTFHPYPLFILDVCISEEKIKIVEANSINTSGYYACDFRRIVDAVIDCVRSGEIL